MPDHRHMLWIGLAEESDQRAAMKFFREHTGELLRRSGFALQRQAYDHVLREEDRARDAFAMVAHYVLCNPERASITSEWPLYPYSGAIVRGYPSLDPRHPDYWDKFWKIHGMLTSQT
jgi:hypothetical protein